MASQHESFGRMKRDAEELDRLTQENNKSLGTYAQTLKDVAKTTKQLNKFKKITAKLDDEILELAKDVKDESQDEKDIRLELLKLKEKDLVLAKKYEKGFEKNIATLRESAKLHKAAGNAMKDGVWKYAKSLPGYFTEQDKAVRQATLSMGIMGKESKYMFDTMALTAVKTTQMGVNMKGLAALQGKYSEQIGRTILLSEKGLTSMAALQEGAFMGDSGLAAEFTANLENFGLNATRATNIMEDGVNQAVKMGVNASKFSKELVKNLKLAQGYNFKGGISALKNMTAQSIRFKMSMESVGGVADKLINPEGAVQMAADLQVLGGAWAKMADPFTLMYQARNDMEGLQKSMIEATAGTAQWNKETKEFDISAMEMHRLREVAGKLGMDYKELAESAKTFAKINKVKTKIDPTLSDDAKEFIGSNSMWSEKEKAWTINLKDENGILKETKISSITKGMEDQILAEDKSLKQRAIDSQTFSDKLNNLIETLKTVALPFIKGIESGIAPFMKNFTASLTEGGTLSDLAEKLQKWGTTVGKWIGDFLGDGKDGAFTTGGNILVKAIVAGVGVMGLLKVASWVANGLALSQGFLMGTKGMMGGPGGSGGSGGMGMGSKASAMSKRSTNFKGNFKGSDGNWRKYAPNSNMSTYAKKPNMLNRAGYGLKNGPMGAKWGMGKSMGIGMGLGALGMGMDAGRGMLSDEDSGLGQTLGVLGSTAKYAGMGAMLGPWGALGGAVVGAGMGMYGESQKKRQMATGQNSINPNQVSHDHLAYPNGKIKDINDTSLNFKPKGPVEKALLGDEKKENSNSGGKLTIDFKPMRIEFAPITINGKNVKMGFEEDPALLRELSGLMQTEMRKAIGGGKVNPNPT